MKIRFLFFGIFLFFSYFISAQNRVDLKVTTLDRIWAKEVVKNKADFNLEGNIKSIKEKYPKAEKYLSQYYFNKSGNLYLKIKRELYPVRDTTEYIFDDTILLEVKQTGEDGEFVQYFNREGLIEKEIQIPFQSETYKSVEIVYTYEMDNSVVKKKYNYPKAESNYVYLKGEEIHLGFDEDYRLEYERIIMETNEHKYGSTKSYSYRNDSKKPGRISFMDNCAGSNSCLILDLNIKYDKNGNIISEDLSDTTVRNSLWSYSYSIERKYNDNSEIIEEKDTSGELAWHHVHDMKKVDKTPPRLYSYEYDDKGNWVKKFTVNGEERELLLTREIEYFTD